MGPARGSIEACRRHSCRKISVLALHIGGPQQAWGRHLSKVAVCKREKVPKVRRHDPSTGARLGGLNARLFARVVGRLLYPLGRESALEDCVQETKSAESTKTVVTALKE